VLDQLPLHATRCEPGPADRRYELEVGDDGEYVLIEDGKVVIRTAALDAALAMLRRKLFFLAVDHARDHLVVSAGVVGHEGGAILLPGPRMAGKTMLVAALLRAGAVYYTDDWAVLDAAGRVVPYPGMLWVKGEGRVSAETFGAASGDTPIPVRLIARLLFTPDGRWDPQARTAGEGVMMLLGHAYGTDDPPAAMKIAHAAAAGAMVLEGERGEAEEAAAALLEIAAQAVGGGSP
jgi:hypothetical protein